MESNELPSVTDLKAGIVAAHRAGNTDDAKALADVLKAHPDYRGNASGMAKFGEGILGGTANIANDLTKLFPHVNLMRQMVQGNQEDPLGKYAKNYKENISPQLGWQGTAGEMVPEVAASIYPVARGARAVTSALEAGGRMLPQALGRHVASAAPAIGDITANAAYSGGKAMLEGEDAGKAALFGGGGAAAGRLLSAGTRGVGRAAVPDMTPEAQTLAREGISMTPGQAYGGILGSAEEGLKKLPFVGGQIERRQGDLAESLLRQKADDALGHINAKSKGTGIPMVEHAKKTIDDAYESVVPVTYARSHETNRALNRALSDLDGIAWSSPAQRRQVEHEIEQVIRPELDALGIVNGQRVNIPGRAMRDLDIRLGDRAAKYMNSSNASDTPLGEAYRMLQLHMKDVLRESIPGAKDAVQEANNAFRKFIPIERATMMSLKNPGGVPHPERLYKATLAAGQKPSVAESAAATVSPAVRTTNAFWRPSTALGSIGLGSITNPFAVLGGYAAGMGAYSKLGLAAQHGAIKGTKKLAKALRNKKLSSTSGAYLGRKQEEE